MRGFARSWALAATLIAGCNPATQLLLVVDTDLEPGVEIAAIEVLVSAGAASASERFELSETPVPFSLGVQPSIAMDERVRVAAIGSAPDGRTVVRFEAETRFVPGAARVLSIPLARACAWEAFCEGAPERTCLRGECVPVAIEPSSLAAPSGSEPEPLFERPLVRPDAGVADSGSTPCVTGASCDAGDPCRVGRLTCGLAPSCEVVETLPEGTECEGGRRCNAEGRCASQS